jgi:hypothetical protein
LGLNRDGTSFLSSRSALAADPFGTAYVVPRPGSIAIGVGVLNFLATLSQDEVPRPAAVHRFCRWL